MTAEQWMSDTPEGSKCSGVDTTNEADAGTRALIALSLVPGLGSARIRSLVSHFGSAVEVLSAPVPALERVSGVGHSTATAIREFDNESAVEEQVRRARLCGARIVDYRDTAYPERLRKIYDPPAFLWIRADGDPDTSASIAIVGTRLASSYGKQLAFRFAGELAGLGYTIVSGLANGIDTAAHEGALHAGGVTIAVMGSGVDRIYPSSNASLAHQIRKSGALVSEHELGAAPDAPNFPRRNRIISGMSVGTLVVEAFEEGGALITARLALEQNREVFAVPYPLFRKNGAGMGNLRLIQSGCAKLVSCVEDIIEELPVRPVTMNSRSAPSPDLDEDDQRILDALDMLPIHIDTLCTSTGLEPSTVLIHLLNLEFRGLVRQLAGKRFIRA